MRLKGCIAYVAISLSSLLVVGGCVPSLPLAVPGEEAVEPGTRLTTGPIEVNVSNGGTVSIEQSLTNRPGDESEAAVRTRVDGEDEGALLPPVPEGFKEAGHPCEDAYLQGWNDGYKDAVAGPDCSSGKCQPLEP